MVSWSETPKIRVEYEHLRPLYSAKNAMRDKGNKSNTGNEAEVFTHPPSLWSCVIFFLPRKFDKKGFPTHFVWYLLRKDVSYHCLFYFTLLCRASTTRFRSTSAREPEAWEYLETPRVARPFILLRGKFYLQCRKRSLCAVRKLWRYAVIQVYLWERLCISRWSVSTLNPSNFEQRPVLREKSIDATGAS